MAGEIAGIRIAVVGGGIIGLAAARAAVRAGAEVTLFERGRIGAGATDAASGLVTLGLRGKSSLRRLKRAGFHAMARWIEELGDRLPPESAARRPSVRLFATTPPDPEKLLSAWTMAGHDARFIEPAEVAAQVPGLDPESFSTGLHLDQEIVVDPPRLVAALREDFEASGGILIEEVGDLTVVAAGPADVALVDGNGAICAEAADRILIASGWQSVRALGPLSGTRFAVAPAGGIGIDLQHPAGRWTVHFGEKGRLHWLRRGENQIYLGSTVREEGSTEPTCSAESDALLAAARHHFPALRGDAVRRVRDGLRPKAIVRGGPFVGAYPGRPRLWIATGHYRIGVSTAAATAEQLVAAWSGGDPIDPGLAVDRGLSDRPGD